MYGIVINKSSQCRLQYTYSTSVPNTHPFSSGTTLLNDALVLLSHGWERCLSVLDDRLEIDLLPFHRETRFIGWW